MQNITQQPPVYNWNTARKRVSGRYFRHIFSLQNPSSKSNFAIFLQKDWYNDGQCGILNTWNELSVGNRGTLSGGAEESPDCTEQGVPLKRGMLRSIQPQQDQCNRKYTARKRVRVKRRSKSPPGKAVRLFRDVNSSRSKTK